LKKQNKALVIRILLIAALLVLVLSLAACGGRKPADDLPDDISQGEGEFRFLNPLGPPEELGILLDAPNFLDQIAEMYELNSDTVGWLFVPNTSVNDAVVWYPGDQNEFYLRRDKFKRSSREGCYYADFRCTFGGYAEGLSRNTTIYGHNMDLNDSPDAPQFSQLLRYLNQDFAEANPYIFFSIREEDLVWEVFAVFYTTVNLPYNTPDMSNDQFMNLINEVTKRSEYIYDVDVTANDKILTLSTCTYAFTPGVYPNDYRYVVMARLVQDGELFKERASLQKNPSPKDP